MSEGNGLPKGWVEATIEDLVGDGVFCDGDWVESEDQDPNGDVRLIQLADVGDGEYRDRSSRFLTSAKAKELNCTFLQEGDLLIARMPDPLGRSAVFPGDSKRSVTVVDVCIVRSSSSARFSHKWLMQFINSPRFRVSVASLQSGSTRKRISRKNLASLSLPVPPLPEQHRIVEKIEELFSDLDAGVASLQRAKANLRRYRASVLKSAVEGRLTEEWRKERPHAKASFCTPPPSTAPLPKKRAGRLWGAGEVPTLTADEQSRLPRGWLWAKVRDLGPLPDEVVQVGPMSMRSQDFESDGVPVLNVGCVQWGGFNESKLDYMPQAKASAFNRYRLRTGDILFTRSGTVGRSAVAMPHQDGWLMTFHLLRVRCDHSVCLPTYLQMVFQGASHVRRQTREASIGSTRAGFNTRLVADLDVPLPPLAEQEQIVALVEERLSQIESAEKTIDAELIGAKRLRQSILRQAFEGKLVPQDPKDEPASVLLERIKATKEQEQPKKKAKKAKAK